MGLTFIHLELPDSALACFSQAVQADSTCCAAWYNSACVHAVRGDTARAFASLKKSLDTGFDRLDHLLQDPDLAPVRQMPAFLDLMRERGYDL
jgi:hypothetical protein